MVNYKTDKAWYVIHPDLAAEWHPTNNNGLNPSDITCGSNKKVWWLLPYDDPKTGKHFNFEWQASVKQRVGNRTGCPYLSGKKIFVGFNDLGSTHPKLSKQWHPTKNGDLKPTDITHSSLLQIWWLLPYDDAITGKHFDFEWRAQVRKRANENIGCPFLSNQQVWIGFNDLKSQFPDLAKEWHPTKNGNLKPTDVFYGSTKKVWWLKSYDDPKTGKHFNFEWEMSLHGRSILGYGCPFLSGQKIWVGFNDLASTHTEIASQWHPTKNGSLKPTEVSAGMDRVVWWVLPYDDPKTGKHFNFEWKTRIIHRTEGYGCPYLSGKIVYQGFNDLQTVRPDLALEWHPTKNGDLKPTDITIYSNRKIWWITEFDGQAYEWNMKICDRTLFGSGCPELTGSHLETAVYRILKKQNVKFKSEKTFDDCRTTNGTKHRYDVFLPDYSLLIECDGRQHFQPIACFGGDDGFELSKQYDSKKNKYAFKNSISLLRIPYTYLKDKNKLENTLMNFIETRQVPDSIIEFYEQFDFLDYDEFAKINNQKFNKLSVTQFQRSITK